MRFATDTISLIGERHVRGGVGNQDYAQGEVFAQSAFALVSDGCSSGGKTDVGSRVLALSTARVVRLLFADMQRAYQNSEDILTQVQEKSLSYVRGSARLFELAQNDLLATRVLAVATPEKGFVLVEGDGAVAIGRRDGSWEYVHSAWEDSMPFYPAYTLSSSERTRFVVLHGSLEALRVIRTISRFNAEGVPLGEDTEYLSVLEGMRGVQRVFSLQEMQDIVALGVFSDGVSAVEGVPWQEVMQEVTRYKNTSGAFLARRVASFVRDLKKRGRASVEDDFSGAMILINHEEEQP